MGVRRGESNPPESGRKYMSLYTRTEYLCSSRRYNAVEMGELVARATNGSYLADERLHLNASRSYRSCAITTPNRCTRYEMIRVSSRDRHRNGLAGELAFRRAETVMSILIVYDLARDEGYNMRDRCAMSDALVSGSLWFAHPRCCVGYRRSCA